MKNVARELLKVARELVANGMEMAPTRLMTLP